MRKVNRRQAGVTLIELRTADVTVSVVLPPTLSSVAVTVAEPRGGPIAVARPLDPLAFETTNPGEEDVHVAAVVRS